MSRQTVFVWYCWGGSGIGTGLRTSPGVCWPQGHGLPPTSCIADRDPDSAPGLDLKPPSGSGCYSPSALAVCGQELLDNLLKDTSRLNVNICHLNGLLKCLLGTPLFTGVEKYLQLQKKKKKNLYRDFCGPRGSCAKSDKLSQMMLLESASTGAEDNKFDNGNKLGVIS